MVMNQIDLVSATEVKVISTLCPLSPRESGSDSSARWAPSHLLLPILHKGSSPNDEWELGPTQPHLASIPMPTYWAVAEYPILEHQQAEANCEFCGPHPSAPLGKAGESSCLSGFRTDTFA